MATLTMSLVVLFLASLMVFYTSSGMLFEIKTGNNQLYQSKAMEAARGSVEHSMAWLVNSSNTSSLAWTADANGPTGTNQKATAASFPSSVSEQSIGGYTVAVSLWRNSATPTILEVSAAASGDANATIRQRIRLGTTTVTTTTPNTLNLASIAPVVINGGLSGVTGKPEVIPSTTGGIAILTSSSQSQISLGENGNDHFDLNGGTVCAADVDCDGDGLLNDSFTTTAWEYLFPNITKAEMKAAADFSKIYFYDETRMAPDPWHASIGTSANPVILIFDEGSGCPTMNGSVTIYGLVYYGDSCQDHGWGGANIVGSMVADMSITKLNANVDFSGWSVNSGTGVITLPPTTTTSTAQTFAKLAASWRDF
ncbi:hypothetical protein [Vogesella indigofera]|uniref:hypothetical protein n=1 Tax=Vogesella indigofera TaxID=45465 RepID=UPI00234E68DE|nr:hypothetical protein [Vogesella indigofera]MDC7707403.1 hypothetical protein [Vogesella indigofera]